MMIETIIRFNFLRLYFWFTKNIIIQHVQTLSWTGARDWYNLRTAVWITCWKLGSSAHSTSLKKTQVLMLRLKEGRWLGSYQCDEINVGFFPVDGNNERVPFEYFRHGFITKHVLEHLNQAILNKLS